MKLYLDDDTADHVLVALLRKVGHDVVIPAELGMSGRRDPDLTPKGIVSALARVDQAYADLGNELVYLNDWR